MPQIPIAESGAVQKKGPKRPTKLAQIRLSHSTVLPGPQSVWALIDVTAPESPDLERPDIDLVPVIDCSGSMGAGPGSPREHAFDATRYVLKRLGGKDRSAVVIYASEVEVLSPLSSDHQSAVEKLQRVSLSGMTALAPGLYEGIEQLGSDKSRTQVVFLLSDGQANEGETDPAKIAAKVKRAAKAGIKLATFGLGPSYNEDLLEALATAGGGGYYYLQTPDDAPRAFAEELAGLLAITARAVKLDLEAKGLKVKRLLGLDADKAPVRIGDLPSGATRTLLVELEVDGQSGAQPDFEVSLSWRDLDDKAARESHDLVVTVSDDESAVAAGVDTAVLAKVAEMEAAYAQAEAARLADAGRFDQARQLIGDQRKRLGDFLGASPQFGVLLNAKVSELEQNFAWLESAQTYSSDSAKLMKSTSYSTRNSRPSVPRSSPPAPPATPSAR